MDDKASMAHALHEQLIRVASNHYSGDGRWLQRLLDNIDETSTHELCQGGPWVTLAGCPPLDREDCGEEVLGFAPPHYTAPVSAYAPPEDVQHIALRAQLSLEESPEPAIFGPDGLHHHAACFNWALGAGEIGAAPWCQALFNWVSYTERAAHPWRTQDRPYKTITVCAMQRRARTSLDFLRPEHRDELDRITREHCARVANLSREQWRSRGHEMETCVSTQLMALAAVISGLTPCAPDTPNAVLLGAYGKTNEPANFSHW